ncbi:MAG TPA: pyridoxamine 5'-phosphate oxidase family protein [Solirubrobacteraceae bacterium]|nr:pyridoxamine 5'-phosphate oxidase family protein [Solirubrobacteraceae bacterium]
MSADEVNAFLVHERTVTCATNGSRGWPHLMPLWYVLRDGAGGEGEQRIWAWTYEASQKMRNLERDSRATLQVESGDTYDQLRGVMLECDVVVHRDTATVAKLGRELFARYAVAPGEPPAHILPDAVTAVIDQQAPKRVGLEFIERRRATWDHRKLEGVY